MPTETVPTGHELDRAIALALDWKGINRCENQAIKELALEVCPAYSSSLDACAEAEAELERRGRDVWMRYIDHLAKMFARDKDEVNRRFGMGAGRHHWLITLDAPTRARAIWEVLRKADQCQK